MLELWVMWSTSSLPSLQGPLWPEVLASDKVLSMSQIELNSVLMLNWIAWNRTVFDVETVYLCETDLFEIELILYAKVNCLELNWLYV